MDWWVGIGWQDLVRQLVALGGLTAKSGSPWQQRLLQLLERHFRRIGDYTQVRFLWGNFLFLLRRGPPDLTFCCCCCFRRCSRWTRRRRSSGAQRTRTRPSCSTAPSTCTCSGSGCRTAASASSAPSTGAPSAPSPPSRTASRWTEVDSGQTRYN